MIKNVPHGSIIESSNSSPHWSQLPNFDAREINLGLSHRRGASEGETADLRLPHVSGRAELFGKILPEWVQPYAVEKEKNPDEGLFTAAALQQRDPDYISVYSWNYQVPSQTVRRYYGDLLAGKFPYAIVFDAETTRVPAWIYPRSDRFPGRPYHHPPAEKLNRVHPEITALSAEYVGAERRN